MKAVKITVVLLALVVLARSSFGGTLVVFDFYFGLTSGVVGEVDAELYDHDKPVTVNNFVRLAEAGAFQYTFFHRCLPGFILQGGGFGAFNPVETNVIAPPYANLFQAGNFGTITNEFKVGKFYSNVYGTMAMAKTSDPNSATSQFFFNLANNSGSLDNTNNSGGFTVFGQVVRGTNVLNYFNTISQGNGIVNLTNDYGVNGFFTDLPAYWTGPHAPPYDDLIYYTVNILTARIQLNPTNGSRQISWPSVNGVTNLVEYATNLPGVWNVLATTNGNGNTFTVTDSSINKAGRFYRIHVLF
jgi:cyclophilin family peptidyl-prolyl cis-trans isomerase